MSAIEDLIAAVKAGDLERVEALVSQDRGLLAMRAASGDTALLTAIYNGVKAIVATLLEQGAPVDVFEAAALGDTHWLRLLLDEQPDQLTAHSHDGWTPLHLAAHFGQAAAIDWLLRRGALVGARSANDLANTPLHAATAGRRRRAVEVLLAAGADPNATDSGGFTSLHLAAQSGELEIARLLLNGGAQVSPRSHEGLTSLALAAQEGHATLVALLSDCGAAD